MVSTNIAAGAKNMNLPPKNHESPSCCKKMLKKNSF